MKGAWIFARIENPTEADKQNPLLRELCAPPLPGQPGALVGHNEITPGYSTLIGRLLLDSTEPGAPPGSPSPGVNGGLTFCAVGLGDTLTWDLDDPPAPDGTETTLVQEFFRKAWSNAYFVDNAGTPQSLAYAIANNLNTVDFEVQFGVGEAVGDIVEIGVYGGDADSTLNSGTLCDYETHPKIPKTNTAILTFVFRWEF